MKHTFFRGGRWSSRTRKTFMQVIIITFLVSVLATLLWIDQKGKEQKAEELHAINIKREQEKKHENEELKKKELEDSFYQKLVDGFDVDILVVGDSIGEGAGTQTEGNCWFQQLQNYIRKTYDGKCNLTNVSMGGNTSYAGYVRTMALNDDISYDLAIICYGQNDSLEKFSLYYESMIRAIRSKYPNCSIISILESSQREYTEKMEIIKSLSDYYGIQIVDTIAAFNNSGKNYDDLTNDGIHPNDAGQNVYFESVKTVIDENIETSTGKMIDVEALNEEVNQLDEFVWYGANSDFSRVDDTTFVLNTHVSGILGIDYTFESGDNKADIYIDGELYKSPTVTFDYDFSQRHIMIVSKECTVEKDIKIVFNSKEQADGFVGMCFSW